MKYKVLKESIVNEMAGDDGFDLKSFFSLKRKTPEEIMDENPGHDVCPNCGAVDDWEYCNGKKYCYQCDWQDPDYHEGPSDEEQMEADMDGLAAEEGDDRECGKCGKPFKYNPFKPGVCYARDPKLGSLCPDCSIDKMAEDEGMA